MKQTIIAVMALILLASCEQKNDAENSPQTATDIAMDGGEEPSYYDFTISRNYGDSMIQHYHRNLVAQIGIDSFKTHAENLSFMIDAEMLRRYLNDNHNIKMLDIYLAQKLNNSKMTLVYIGAEDSTAPDGKKYYVERTIQKPGETKDYVLDQVAPCPDCKDRIANLGGWDADAE